MKARVLEVIQRTSKKGQPYWKVKLQNGSPEPVWATVFENPWFGPGDELDLAIDDQGIIRRDGSSVPPDPGIKQIRARLLHAAAIIATRFQGDAQELLQWTLDIAKQFEDWVNRPIGR